jgi:signal transduction histidine kinase/ActR/RegA family two-component response regulator
MPHSVAWVYDQLGLLALREEDGGIAVSAALRQMLGSDEHPSLGTALRALLGDGFDTRALDRAIVTARSGTPHELAGPRGERLLIAPSAPGRAQAVIVPAPRGVDAATSKRADLTAGVSHELANALGAIAGWARLAKQGRRVQEALDLIEMSAESAWSAARRMLGNGREQGGDKEHESVDLSSFVDEAARLLAPKSMAKGVRVRTSIQPGLRVRGDRGSAWSIVWNLAANAVEALSPGGTVELRLSGTRDAALLVVEDDGPGMSEEQQRRAFEPYYTTKAAGTGLGLALVKQAVSDVGGSVELKSEPSLGTRFTVVFPLASGSAQRASNTKRSSGVFYAEPIHQRILVVDDDLGLREMIATALGMRGAEVVAVGSAEAALAQQGAFALAIVDLLLPDLRGDALLVRLRNAGVAEVGLLVTGTELPANLAAGGAPDVVLRKPFELEELFEALALALERARQADPSSAAG